MSYYSIEQILYITRGDENSLLKGPDQRRFNLATLDPKTAMTMTATTILFSLPESPNPRFSLIPSQKVLKVLPDFFFSSALALAPFMSLLLLFLSLCRDCTWPRRSTPISFSRAR